MRIVRDEGVVGSNPITPTNLLADPEKSSPTGIEAAVTDARDGRSRLTRY